MMNFHPIANRRQCLQHAACGFGALALHDMRPAATKVSGARALGAMAPVKPRGQSGMMISGLMPNLAEIADDICLLRGMNADNPQHASAENQFHTGSYTEVRPSMGSWISYGLGSENQNLPSFITIHSKSVRTYGSAFLPAIHHGTALTIPLDSKSSPIANLKNASISEDVERKRLDHTRRMDERLLDDLHGDRSMKGMIQNMELAFRMQTETPSLVDVSKENVETLEMNGFGGKDTPWSQDLSGTVPIDKHGREHQPQSFCAWMAGGGIKPGLTYGETDEMGFKVIDGKIRNHDLHATMLHLLGLDRTRLTWRNVGREFRLTDVYGSVMKEILA